MRMLDLNNFNLTIFYIMENLKKEEELQELIKRKNHIIECLVKEKNEIFIKMKEFEKLAKRYERQLWINANTF